MSRPLPSPVVELLYSLAAADAPHPNLVYEGKQYINVNNLYDAKMWPERFTGVGSKQSKRTPVTQRMKLGTEYIYVLPKHGSKGQARLVLEDSPYMGTKEPKQAHVLISLQHLLSCPLQDPRTKKHKGTPSKGFNLFKQLWTGLQWGGGKGQPAEEQQKGTETKESPGRRAAGADDDGAATKEGPGEPVAEEEEQQQKKKKPQQAAAIEGPGEPAAEEEEEQKKKKPQQAAATEDGPDEPAAEEVEEQQKKQPQQAAATEEGAGEPAETASSDDLCADYPLYLPYQAPLELTDAEKFRDQAGNIHELDFFGERTPGGCYLDAKGIGEMLGIKQFYKTLCDQKSKYIAGRHFAYIPMEPFGGQENCPAPLFGTGWSTNPDPSIRWRRVLTCDGTVRALYTSRSNPVADYYCSWATKVLFVHHLGSDSQRTQLAAELMGFHVDDVRKFLSSCCASNLAGVYLWVLGTVGELRDKLLFDEEHLLPDDFVVGKLGLSEHFYDRSGSLRSELKRLGVTSMRLFLFAPVYADSLHPAENDAKDWLKEREEVLKLGVKFDGFTEVIAFSTDRHVKAIIKTEFKNLSLQYGGATSARIKDMQTQLQLSEAHRKAAEDMYEAERRASEAERRTSEAERRASEAERRAATALVETNMLWKEQAMSYKARLEATARGL